MGKMTRKPQHKREQIDHTSDIIWNKKIKFKVEYPRNIVLRRKMVVCLQCKNQHNRIESHT